MYLGGGEGRRGGWGWGEKGASNEYEKVGSNEYKEEEEGEEEYLATTRAWNPAEERTIVAKKSSGTSRISMTGINIPELPNSNAPETMTKTLEVPSR